MSDGPTSKTAVSRQVPHARPAESLVAGEPAALKAALQSPPVSARPARDGATDDWHTCLARSVVSRPDGPQRRSNNHRVAWKTLTQHPTDRIHADDQQPDRPLYGQPRCRNGRAELHYILGLEGADARQVSSGGPGSVPKRERALSVGAVEHEARRPKRMQVGWTPHDPSRPGSQVA
ncbi:hypothetical protein NKR19_g3427 [Coniochaeta hoffmannii]|uniref:Uncharacterized protein n=1 Tax=Coniochaeta hoffmannii TaxID=91930 RepID=A0AA38RUG8_9PEZI|nr:hypothetical protein NKR19_g3427 [Coniochaeta hoffmannii]